MGAEFYTSELKDKVKVYKGRDLRAWFLKERESCAFDWGHAGYTGTFAETPGIDAKMSSFESWDEAFDWIEEHTKKWENALAVRVKGKDPGWAVGAWCSS